MSYFDDLNDRNQQNQNQNPQTPKDNYTNLSQYLQNNDASGLANNFSGKIQDQTNAAKQDISNAQTDFTGQVKQSNSTPTQGQVNGALNDPTNADAKQFQGWEHQTYKGPTDINQLGSYQKARGEASQAQQSAGLAGTNAGRETLLGSYFGQGGKTYGQGQKSLDSFLLGNANNFDPANLQNQANALGKQSRQAQNAGFAQAGQAAGNVERSAQNVRNMIGIDDKGGIMGVDPTTGLETGTQVGALGSDIGNVGRNTWKANNANSKALTSMQDALNSGYLTSDQLGQTGLSDGQNLYGLQDKLSSYLTAAAPLNNNQVMTPEQQARIQALSKLAGVTDTFAASPLQAAPTAPYTFDSSRLAADINANKSAYNAATDNLLHSNKVFTDPNAQNEYAKQASDYRNALAALNTKYGQEKFVHNANNVKKTYGSLVNKLRGQ